ncbi:carboxypeptidase regulatory-like domain-containing protein [Paludibaculum fermentans]|uniref:TonB-dependent receptor n=1 Tax=Paludibaculum fermentans TaxID=1473598 RepID=UPI003EC13F68
MRFRTLSVTALLAFSLALSALAQNAQITGMVKDPTDAPIAGATVNIIATDTGSSRQVITSPEGYYTAPLLPRGRYEVVVEMKGFKGSRNKDLLLEEGQSLRLDIRLEMGQVSETVEVVASAGLLSTETTSVSTVVPNQRVVDLPLSGRNPLLLANLVPGVRPVGSFGGMTVSSFDGSRVSIAGGAPSTNNFMVDGVAAENFASGGIQITLSPDATEEFRVITRNPSAEYGRTGGGIANFVSKAGTNSWHGSAFEFLKNKQLNANSFFSNYAGAKRAPFVFNQYGATLGGPVRKDQTFFFFNWEKVAQRGQDQTFRTVPTDLQRKGDFSQTFDAAGRLVVIYDPSTTAPNPAKPGSYLRTPIAGNVIPANRISAVAAAVSSYYPAGNTAGNAFTRTNNFFGQASAPVDKDVYGVRVDHNFNQSRRIFGRYTYDKTFRGSSNFYDNVAETNTSDLPFKRNSAVLSYIETLRPTLLLETRVGLNRYFTPRVTRSYGFDVTKLSMNAIVNSQMQLPVFPNFSIGDMSGLGAAADDHLIQANDSYTAAGSLTWIHSAHNFKFGTEFRTYRANNNQMCGSILALGFGRGFTQGSDPNVAATNAGFGYASFLLGDASSGGLTRCPTVTYQVPYGAVYAQDDWKVTPRITLNLGLRYEVEGALTDRYNAMSMWDPTAAYSSGGINMTGGLVYPGVNGRGRGNRQVSYKDFEPRLGLSYQLFKKTVVRSSYGILHLPTTGVIVRVGQSGFAATSAMVTSVDGGFTPSGNIANPFPDGINLPSGSSQGLLTGIGTSIGGNLLNLQRGYSQQWNFNVQQELGGGWIVELGYMGNRGVSLPANRTFRYLPQSVLSQGTALQQLVPNPFAAIVKTGPLAQANVTRATLLNYYPQFSGSSGLDSWADSIYHAATMRLEKRFSHGLSLLASYTFSKLIDNNLGNGVNNFADGGDNGVQNWDNLRAERAVSTSDLPQRLVMTASYELPFLKNSKGIANAVLGGWQLNPIVTLQSGNVISVTANAPAFGGGRPDLIGDPSVSEPTIDNWLNKAAFAPIQPFTFGNAPRNLPTVRTDGMQNIDLSVLKNFRLKERYKVQFRAEFFNLTNTPTFGNPTANISSGSFGTIRSLATNTGPRNIQLALKFLF